MKEPGQSDGQLVHTLLGAITKHPLLAGWTRFWEGRGMPPSCHSSGLGDVIQRQTYHQHSILRKAGLGKWKEFHGLPGAQRKRCVLIPNISVYFSDFSSDLLYLLSSYPAWIQPAQTLLSALLMEAWSMRLQTFLSHSVPLSSACFCCNASLPAIGGGIQPGYPISSPTSLLQA